METRRVGRKISNTLTDGQPSTTAPRNNLTINYHTLVGEAEGHVME